MVVVLVDIVVQRVKAKVVVLDRVHVAHRVTLVSHQKAKIIIPAIGLSPLDTARDVIPVQLALHAAKRPGYAPMYWGQMPWEVES